MGIYHLPTFRAWRRCRSLAAVLGILFLWLCFISVINPDISALEPATRDILTTSVMGFRKGASSSSASSSSSVFSISSARAFIDSSPLENHVEYAHSINSLDTVFSMQQKAQHPPKRGPLTVRSGAKFGRRSRDLSNGLIRGRRIQEIRSTKTGTDFGLSGVKVYVEATGSSPSVREDEQIDGYGQNALFSPLATEHVQNMQQSIGRDSETFSQVGRGSFPISRLHIPTHEGRTNRGQFEPYPSAKARDYQSLATRYNLSQGSTVEKLRRDALTGDVLPKGEKSIASDWPRGAGKRDSRWADLYDSSDVAKMINKRFQNDQSDSRQTRNTVSKRHRSDMAENSFQNSVGNSVNLNSVVSDHSIKGVGPVDWSTDRGRTSMQMTNSKSPGSEDMPPLPRHLIDQPGNLDDEALAMKLDEAVSPHPAPPAHRDLEVNEGNGDNLNVLQSYKTLARPHEKREGNNGSAHYQHSPARGGSEVTNWGSRNDEKAAIDGGLGIRSRDETTQLGAGGIDEEERTKDGKEKDKTEMGTERSFRRHFDEMRQGNRSPVADTSSVTSSNETLATDVAWKGHRGHRLKSDGFQRYAYNVTASDAIGLRRVLPDTRPPGCDLLPAYSRTNLPKATVVICFHNEALSVLLRTVHSVLYRTPAHLLDHIILVDDNSTFDELGEELREHLHPLGSTVVLKRTKGRQGLTRSRLLGASQVRSDVIVFLDAHVECNVGWLEPLLSALVDTPNMVASPYIDTIKSESFQYKRSPSGLQGGFNWRLEFGWRAASTHSTDFDSIEPIRTPVISGGLLAVRTEYFKHLEGYDPHLEIWGGENFELSFKTWMCGGSMVILPCSRVGHVFRASLPYKFKDDRETTVLRNLARVANVWMDEYSEIFEAAVNLPINFDIGDISERVEIRQKLGCKSFQWYLKHVYPQMEMVPGNAVLYGQMRNKGSLMCIEVKKDNFKYYLGLSACKGGENQTFYLTNQGLLKYGEACIIPSIDKQLTISSCVHNFTWIHQEMQLHAANAKDLCLVSVDNEVVHLLPCVTKQDPSTDERKFLDNSSSIKPKHQAAILNQKLSLDFSEEDIFQQWTFDYSFNWKRKRRR